MVARVLSRGGLNYLDANLFAVSLVVFKGLFFSFLLCTKPVIISHNKNFYSHYIVKHLHKVVCCDF